MEIGDPETTERAFRSDAYRQEIGWGPRELQQALDAADGFDAKYGTDTSGADFVKHHRSNPRSCTAHASRCSPYRGGGVGP